MQGVEVSIMNVGESATKKEKGRKKKLVKKIQKACCTETSNSVKNTGINSYKAFYDCLLMGLQVWFIILPSVLYTWKEYLIVR